MPFVPDRPRGRFVPDDVSAGDVARGAINMRAAPIVGPAETLLQLGTGSVAMPLAGLAGIGAAATNAIGLTDTPAADVVNKVAGGLTYQPRTQAGQAVSRVVSWPFEKLAQGADWAGQKVSDATGSPAAGAATNAAIQVLPAVALGRTMPKRAATKPAAAAASPEAVARSYVASNTSLDWNALGESVRQRITEIARDSRALENLDPVALERQVKLESLKVPVPATRGMLTRDPVQLRNEGSVSATAAGQPIRDIHLRSNQAILDNLEALKGRVRSAAETPEQVGLSIQDKALRPKLKLQEQEVSRLYKLADESGETAQAVDISPILDLIERSPDNTHYGWAESWLRKTTNPKPVIEGGKAPPIEKMPGRNMRTPDATQDSILQYLAKHRRGLDMDEALLQGIDPADTKLSAAHAGINRAFRKGGMTFDEASELLSEAGYNVRNSAGQYDPNVLLDQISAELGGRKAYSDRNTRVLREMDYERAVTTRDLQQMAEKARKVDPDAVEAVLESQASDAVVLERLQEIVGAKAGAAPELSIRALEDLRQAAVARAKDGGTAGHYAGQLIREIDRVTEGGGGDLYKAARAARKSQAMEFEEQGAVARLVENKSRTDRATPVEDTWRRTVLGGSIDDLRKVKRSMLTGGSAETRAAGKQAWRDLQGQTIQHIINEATKSVTRYQDGSPNVTPAAMERAIRSIGEDKLSEIFSAPTVGRIGDVMEATRIVKTEPPPGFKGSPTFANELAFNALDKVPVIGRTAGSVLRGGKKLYDMGAAERDVAAAENTPIAEALEQAARGRKSMTRAEWAQALADAMRENARKESAAAAAAAPLDWRNQENRK